MSRRVPNYTKRGKLIISSLTMQIVLCKCYVYLYSSCYVTYHYSDSNVNTSLLCSKLNLIQCKNQTFIMLSVLDIFLITCWNFREILHHSSNTKRVFVAL